MTAKECEALAGYDVFDYIVYYEGDGCTLYLSIDNKGNETIVSEIKAAKRFGCRRDARLHWLAFSDLAGHDYEARVGMLFLKCHTTVTRLDDVTFVTEEQIGNAERNIIRT